MSITESDLVLNLDAFVKDTCKDRDESHGYTHMKKVYENTLTILNMINFSEYQLDIYEINNVRKLSIISSWLHDVFDYKYDTNGILKKKCALFMEKKLLIDKNNIDLIINIIDRISFSKQVYMMKTNGFLDWDIVLGKNGTLIRNIVSDADKMESLGKIGMDRCIIYKKEMYYKRYGSEISIDQLKEIIYTYSKTRMLILYPSYIMTNPGKILCKPLYEEFCTLLEDFVKK